MEQQDHILNELQTAGGLSRQTIFPGWGVLLVAVVFAASAVAKGLNPAPTAGTVQAMLGVGAFGRAAAIACLIAVECTLAGWLLFSRGESRPALLATLTFLLCVNAVPVWQLMTGSVQRCGCGFPGLFQNPRADQISALVRNTILIALVIISFRAEMPSDSHRRGVELMP